MYRYVDPSYTCAISSNNLGEFFIKEVFILNVSVLYSTELRKISLKERKLFFYSAIFNII